MAMKHASCTDRRRFLSQGVALGAASALGPVGRVHAGEPGPETTRIRIEQSQLVCVAPQIVAEAMLRAEGFTDVQYVTYLKDTPRFPPEDLLADEVDMTFSFTPTDIQFIDRGAPVMILGAAHTGCVELVAKERVRTARDLKGKRIGITTDTRVFISMFIAYVGLDPQKDVEWVQVPLSDEPRQFSEGKIDAFMCSPPMSLMMRRKRIGHVLVSTTADKPWSQYSCCLIASTQQFVQKHPIAAKRALRAIIKSVDLCARDPAWAARIVAERGLGDFDLSLQSLREVPYANWREIDVADSVRFWALRLRDVRAIKSSPQEIIARGVDLRPLNEIKRELKG